MDELEYITKNALMMCDKGGAPDLFKPTFNTTVEIHGCLVATNVDAAPIVNIPSFKVCKITRGPCVPATVPNTWLDTWQVKVKGSETLIGKSTCKCPIGGTVEFMTSGQVPLPPEAAAEVKELQDQAQRELDDSGQGNSVGETGFVEGMIPVWGSGRDMINDIQTGDVGGTLLNAGFLIWDVASIAAGVVSFGAGTALMQGAKAGVKTAIKAAKAISKEALEQLGKQVFKKLNKEALKKSVKEVAEKLLCAVVKACFTGETLVHTSDGLRQIKDIQVGDEVLSYDNSNLRVVIQKVHTLFVDEVHQLLEIQTEQEIIRTTPNHPFFVNGEFKDAGQIKVGDFLFSKEKSEVKVVSVNHLSEIIKVYNFEVEENHCYFVGKKGVLVLNICHIATFFKAFPELKGVVSQVHHAIPQKVFKKWPELFDKSLKNSLENLRGIPKEGASALHQGSIHKEWNKFYKAFEKAGIKPTKEQVETMVKKIDDTFGHLFNPPIK